MKRHLVFFALTSIVLFTSCRPGCVNDSYVKGWVFRNCIDNSYLSSVAQDFSIKVQQDEINIDGLDINNLSNYQTVKIYLMEDLDEIRGDYYKDEERVIDSLKRLDVFNFDQACMAYFETSHISSNGSNDWLPQKRYDFPKRSMDDYLSLFSEYYYDNQREPYIEAKGVYSNRYPDYDLKIEKKETCQYYIYSALKNNNEEAKYVISNIYESFFYYVQDIGSDEVKLLKWKKNYDKCGDSYTGYLVQYEIGEDYYVLLDLVEYGEKLTFEILYMGDDIITLDKLYDKFILWKNLY